MFNPNVEEAEILSRRQRRVIRRHRYQLAKIGDLPRVRGAKKGNIIIAALTPDSIRARGKVEPDLFFPDFCRHMARLGYATDFVFDAKTLLARTRRKNACIIHIYNELRDIPSGPEIDEAHARATAVFNLPASGWIIRNKAETHRHLTAHGVPMPPREFGQSDQVFSNEMEGTSQPAWVTSAASIDPKRYNTRFIDTRVPYEGEDYFTTVRLLTIGEEIVHAFVGARKARAGKPTVHGVNTPRNAGLVNFLFERLYEERQSDMKELAAKVAKALGLGFYHLDLMIERGTGALYLCEVGYKFDAYAYGSHMAPVQDEVACLAPFYSSDYAEWAAEAFVRRWEGQPLSDGPRRDSVLVA